MKVMFKEGDDVAFKNNLYLKMTVKEIILKTIEIPVREKEDGTGFEKEKRRVLDGILCFWMKGQELMEYKFRSDSLIPWEIAIKGAEASIKYLEDIKKERTPREE